MDTVLVFDNHFVSINSVIIFFSKCTLSCVFLIIVLSVKKQILLQTYIYSCNVLFVITFHDECFGVLCQSVRS